MIGVLDYGAGNHGSVANALRALGAEARLCAQPRDLDGLERLILPGVGHFGAAARELERRELAPVIREFAASGRPLLGICLGLQLLFEASEEALGAPGLALLPGRSLALSTRVVPHMGWNRVEWLDGRASCPAYFAHSFHVVAAQSLDVCARVEHEGQQIVAACRRANVFGVQFHPEKSGPEGLGLLAEWLAC